MTLKVNRIMRDNTYMALGQCTLAQDLLDNVSVHVGPELVVEVGIRSTVVYSLVAVPNPANTLARAVLLSFSHWDVLVCAEDLERLDHLSQRDGRVGQPLLEVRDAVQEDEEVVVFAFIMDPGHLFASASHVVFLLRLLLSVSL
jgi:hypothetical protein